MIERDCLFSTHRHPTNIRPGRLTIAPNDTGKFDASVSWNRFIPFVIVGLEPAPEPQLLATALTWLHLAHDLIFRGYVEPAPDEPDSVN